MQDKEMMFSVLEVAGTNPRWIEAGDSGFSRTIEFDTPTGTCWIEWWSNLAYLHVGARYGVDITFHRVEANTTWPNYLTCLRFINDQVTSSDGYVHLATKLLNWQEKRLATQTEEPESHE